MLAIAGRLRAAWCWVTDRRPISWLRRPKGQPGAEGPPFPSIIDHVIYDPEHDATFSVLRSTPERVKRLREAAKQAGLDIKIGEEPVEPPAVQPTKPVHKEG